MNREADRVIRVTGPLKKRLDHDLRKLQLDTERQVTYSEMLAAAWDQVVYLHLLTDLRNDEGGQA